MGIVNGAALKAAETGYRAHYQNGLALAKPMHAPFSREVPSTGPIEEHILPDGAPQLRKWVGDRVATNPRMWSFSLRNEKYAATEAVGREYFEDDTLGVFAGRMEMMGNRVATHPDKLWADLLSSGFASVGYDEVPFYSANHPKQGGVQSNTTTAVLDEDAFDDGVAAFLGFTDWRGEPLDLQSMSGGLYLVVPPALRATALGIVGVERLADGGSNKNYKAAELVVCPRLATDTEWHLLWGGGSARAFIRQNRTAAEFTSLTDPESDHVFKNDEFLFGVRMRYTMGYLLWQAAYGSTGAGS